MPEKARMQNQEVPMHLKLCYSISYAGSALQILSYVAGQRPDIDYPAGLVTYFFFFNLTDLLSCFTLHLESHAFLI